MNISKDKPINPLIKFKRTIIYSLILVLVLVGHYHLMHIPYETFRYIRWSMISMLSCLCLGGSLMLMTRKNAGRAHSIFTAIMFLTGLTNVLSLIRGMITGYAAVVDYKFLSVPMLMYGCTYAYFFLLYPIEAFRPGWLTIKRAFLLFLPTITIPGIYLLLDRIQNHTTPEIVNINILSHECWSYKVWIPLALLIYPVFGLVVMLRYQNNYKEWCKNNFASFENLDIKWLHDYIFSNFIITLSCLVVVFSNKVESVLMHNIIFLVFFLYSFYRVLFQKSPYPEGYFKMGMDETRAEKSEELNLERSILLIENKTENQHSESIPNSKNLFPDKLPEYKNKLEHWMKTEKPYIRKDFKLIDAMEILPLNRSYLSRLFNDGYGESFYQFVMRYRIAESKHLLLTRPDLNITSIADLSGFSSPSVFGRAFLQETNYSPLQWREEEKKRTGIQ